MRKIAFVLFFCLFFAPHELSAQDGDDPFADPGNTQANDESAELKLIQPYQSKSLGQLTLPAIWDIQEDKQSLRAVEKNHKQPAVIQFFLIERLFQVSAVEYIEHLLKTLDGMPNEQRKLVRERIYLGENQEVEAQGACFTALENGHAYRHCVLVMAAQQILIVSISAPTERQKLANMDNLKSLVGGMN